MAKPNFFLVGAPKCATSSMYQYLRQHPDIFLTPYKQPHYFSTDLWHRHSDFYDAYMTPEGYLSLYKEAQHETVLGEASEWYLYSSTAAEEIHKFNPDAKILILLRNPVDFLYSLHSQLLLAGEEKFQNFHEALEATVEDRRAKGMRVQNRFLFGVEYRKAAQFCHQIERYRALFPPEQIKIVLFDDIKGDPSGSFADICRFLQVDPTFQPDFNVVNPAKTIRSQTLMKLFWTQSPFKKIITRRLPQTWRLAMSGAVMKLATREQKRAPLNAALRQRLREEFTPEVERLGAMINRDLSAWTAATKQGESPRSANSAPKAATAAGT